MNKIEQKEEYLEKNGYILLPGDKETAMVLFEEKESIFKFISRFFSQFKKLSQLKETGSERNNI